MGITIFTLGSTRKNAETFFGLLRRSKVRRSTFRSIGGHVRVVHLGTAEG